LLFTCHWWRKTRLGKLSLLLLPFLLYSFFFFQIITRVFFMENDKGFWWFSAVCFYFSFLILIFLLFLGLIPKNRLGLGTQKITGLNQISFNHMMKKLMFTKIIMGKTKRVHLFKDFIKWEVHQLKSTSSPSNLLFKDFITWFYHLILLNNPARFVYFSNCFLKCFLLDIYFNNSLLFF